MEAVFHLQLVPLLAGKFFRLPENDHIVVVFIRRRQLEQPDRARAPVAERLSSRTLGRREYFASASR